ncbi:hypothetical protein PIROE2DRAFT_62245 [Piromyces sp. E2]|nr:hypothetical protein PIROE2DRAFT_62245 [Piromyces sp. E2]|eukprot:OUM61862.1 hypothetical protein PIROE2DRAFT_62245 [Piromyces sp. E2]
MEDIEEIEQEQADYSLFLNKKNLSYVPKIIKNQLNDTKNDEEKQENIINSLNNLKKVISESHVVSSRNLSVAKWDYSLSLAIVTVKHGNLFETMGKVYSYLKRLGYIILEHETGLPITNIGFNDDKKDILQNNINNVVISSDNNSNFLKEHLTKSIDNFSSFMEKFVESKLISSTPFAHLCRKGVYWFDKLFTVPFSLAFCLETNSKINYFKDKKDNTQPLYNYYDDNSLVDYDVYKPNGQYTKKKKSLPDFYLIVQSCN